MKAILKACMGAIILQEFNSILNLGNLESKELSQK